MGYYSSKIKISKADKLFSEYVRKRDGKCVFKQRCYGELRDIKGLNCCHFHSRRYKSTRHDPRNADAGCAACHQWIDHTAEGQRWHLEFKLQQLGEQELGRLELKKRRLVTGSDDETTVLWLKQLITELKKQEAR